MVCGTPGRFRLHAFKAELVQIQLLDEHINDPDRVILSNVVVEMLREQGALRTVFAFDKSLHRALRLTRWLQSARCSLHYVFTRPRSIRAGGAGGSATGSLRPDGGL